MIPEVKVEDLFDWVDAKEVNSKVGTPGSLEHCLIADYIKSLGYTNTMVCNSSLGGTINGLGFVARTTSLVEKDIISAYDGFCTKITPSRENVLEMLSFFLKKDVRIPVLKKLNV